MWTVTVAVLVLLGLSAQRIDGGRVSIHGTRFVKDGKTVFLSGANTAWASYGYDFGDGHYQWIRNIYLRKLDMVKNAGGNSMRTWVHISGQVSPLFDASGHVTGLDSQGTFIADFKRYLDDAEQRGILVFPCLWSGAKVDFQERLHGLITDTAKLQSYLDNALIPWVKAVKDHPAMGGWDIINEFEGFLKPDLSDAEPCFDTRFLHDSGAGWAGKLYTAHDLLRFVNWQVDAIRRTDPHALVTAGSWSQNSQVDKWGKKNLYSDHCLVTAGGKQHGKLNFYSTHAYAWSQEFPSESVFKHSSADFGLDKPLVVAEFEEGHSSGMTSAQLFRYVYSHGYQGAWVWSDSSEVVQASGIHALQWETGAGGVVNFPL